MHYGDVSFPTFKQCLDLFTLVLFLVFNFLIAKLSSCFQSVSYFQRFVHEIEKTIKKKLFSVFPVQIF